MDIGYNIGGYNAELVDGKWTFSLYLQSNKIVNYYYTIKTILNKNDGTEEKALTRCYMKKELNHICTVQAANQLDTDILYLCNDIEGTSTQFSNGILSENQIISRKASLTFVKAYGLKYNSSIWNVNIEVEEGDFRSGMNVTVDIVEGTRNYKAGCLYENKILSCKGIDQGQNIENLVQINFEQISGSVTWNNKDSYPEKKTKIPLDVELTYDSSFLLEYAEGAWNFKLKVKIPYLIPPDSLILVDISGESAGLASCEGNKQVQARDLIHFHVKIISVQLRLH